MSLPLTPAYVLLLASLFAPMLALLGVAKTWAWWRQRRRVRSPFSEKLLRPAGESLRLKIIDLEDKITQRMLALFVVPPLALAALLVQKADRTSLAVIGVVIAAGFVFQTRTLLRSVIEKRNCELGYLGERAVAEELNRLMLDGCQVFHDVPMESCGNIDHVVVAPHGIYAVESKARRKRAYTDDKPDHKLNFDGQRLQFPSWEESLPLLQTERQARVLRDYLSEAVCAPIQVEGILTFPGWWVDRTGKGIVRVLNPKEIRSAVTDQKPPKLDAQLVRLVARQLEMKCRDVTF